MADGSTSGIEVPARFIPTPRSVSPEAQAFLSRGLDIQPPQIALDDKDGWRNYIAMVERMMLPGSAERANKFHPAEVHEHRAGAVAMYEVVPDSLDAERTDRAIYHIHGGAFIVGGGLSCAYSAQPIAHAAGLRSFSVDYRMPPDHPFPTGLEDCLDGYRFLLERHAPEKIVVEGSSAGANLAAAVILLARDRGLPMPGACILHTAATDLSDTGDTMQTNQVIDVVLRSAGNGAISLYCGDADRTDPYLSPVYADYAKGFPPTQLISGTRDMLLSPTVMMHRALRRAGLEAELHVFEAMPHGGFGNASPEDFERIGESAKFIAKHL